MKRCDGGKGPRGPERLTAAEQSWNEAENAKSASIAEALCQQLRVPIPAPNYFLSESGGV
jgi:hypothetical protein